TNTPVPTIEPSPSITAPPTPSSRRRRLSSGLPAMKEVTSLVAAHIGDGPRHPGPERPLLRSAHPPPVTSHSRVSATLAALQGTEAPMPTRIRSVLCLGLVAALLVSCGAPPPPTPPDEPD